MAEIKANFGQGGVGIQPGHGSPDLATALRDAADDIADLAGGLVDWTAELTVASHTVTLSRAGAVTSVEATTATSAGVKQIQYSASPAAGYVQVAYSSGIATLTFNAADAVTGARVVLTPSPATIRTTKG